MTMRSPGLREAFLICHLRGAFDDIVEIVCIFRQHAVQSPRNGQPSRRFHQRRQRDDRRLGAFARRAQCGRAGFRPGDDGARVNGVRHFVHRRHDGIRSGFLRRRPGGIDKRLIERIALQQPRRSCPSSPRLRPDAAPVAVSAESITASAPSNTAVATSDTSARVGPGASIIDSSICVATITGLPTRRAARVISFCRRAPSPSAAQRRDRRAPPSEHRPDRGFPTATPAPLAFRSWREWRRVRSPSCATRQHRPAAARTTAPPNPRRYRARHEDHADLCRHGRKRQQGVGQIHPLAIFDLAAQLHDRLSGIRL